MSPAPPLPVRAALAHGVGGCMLLAFVALGWLFAPVPRTEIAALLATAAIGVVAWAGAAIVAAYAPRAANDNDAGQAFSGSWPQFISE